MAAVCSVPECRAKRRTTHLMCREHWFQVPDDLRKRAWACSRAYRDDRNKETSRDFGAAMRACIESVRAPVDEYTPGDFTSTTGPCTVKEE